MDTESLLILKDGGRICADSPMEEDPVSAIGGGVGHGVFSLVEMQLLGVLCGQPVVWVVAVFENIEDELCYRKLCECMWAAYRVGRNLLCVFRKYMKLYLSQKAGHPFPLFHYVLRQVCLGQTRMISSCIRQSHSTETQHIVQTTACF